MDIRSDECVCTCHDPEVARVKHRGKCCLVCPMCEKRIRLGKLTDHAKRHYRAHQDHKKQGSPK